MSQTPLPSYDESEFDQSKFGQSDPYEICVKGHLSDKWTDWFDGLTISLEESGNTRLTGHIVDQAALHGLLAKIRDLGLPLVSLTRISRPQKTKETESEKTDHENTSTSHPEKSQSKKPQATKSQPTESQSKKPHPNKS